MLVVVALHKKKLMRFGKRLKLLLAIILMCRERIHAMHGFSIVSMANQLKITWAGKSITSNLYQKVAPMISVTFSLFNGRIIGVKEMIGQTGIVPLAPSKSYNKHMLSQLEKAALLRRLARCFSRPKVRALRLKG